MPDQNEIVDKLATEVQEDSDVKNSAITLLNNLKSELDLVKAELAKEGVTNERLNTLTSALDSSSNALADAVTANTPVAG